MKEKSWLKCAGIIGAFAITVKESINKGWIPIPFRPYGKRKAVHEKGIDLDKARAAEFGE